MEERAPKVAVRLRTATLSFIIASPHSSACIFKKELTHTPERLSSSLSEKFFRCSDFLARKSKMLKKRLLRVARFIGYARTFTFALEVLDKLKEFF
jgi:hypothetical protein